jgi:hypothetical protein
MRYLRKRIQRHEKPDELRQLQGQAENYSFDSLRKELFGLRKRFRDGLSFQKILLKKMPRKASI